MSFSDAAWIGPTLVAVVASYITYRVHQTGLEAERQRWSRERKAAVQDRRLETVRDGYLSLMASAGALVAVASDITFPEARYVVEAYEQLKKGLRETGGVVDAFGCEDSRDALERTRRLVAEMQWPENALHEVEKLRSAPEPDHEEIQEQLSNAAVGITTEQQRWHATLTDLLDAMRDDLRRFEAETDSEPERD